MLLFHDELLLSYGFGQSVSTARDDIADLKKPEVPKELKALVESRTRSAEIALALSERLLAYYKSWLVTEISKPLLGVDPKTECADIVRRAQEAKLPQTKFGIVSYEWSNCMNRKLRPDPESDDFETWRKFLEAYGLKEECEENG